MIIIGGFVKKILALILLSTLPSCVDAAEKANVFYEKTESTAETIIKEKLISFDVVNSVLVFFRKNLRLSSTLTILFGGEDGPFFDSKDNNIVIPYALIQVVESRFVLAVNRHAKLTRILGKSALKSFQCRLTF